MFYKFDSVEDLAEINMNIFVDSKILYENWWRFYRHFFNTDSKLYTSIPMNLEYTPPKAKRLHSPTRKQFYNQRSRTRSINKII